MGDVPMDELRLIDGIEQIDIKDFNYRHKQKKNQLRDLLDTLIHHHRNSDMSIDEGILKIFSFLLPVRALGLTGGKMRYKGNKRKFASCTRTEP